MTYSKYSSRGYRWITCAVCGDRCHVRDVVRITDKYNTFYGLNVCKRDAQEKTNPQARPFKIRKETIYAPTKITPPPTPSYVTNENDDRLPGAPQNGAAIYESLAGVIYLTWDGPSDSGSSGITGYVVQVANPQFSNYITLSANTGTPATYYTDYTTSLTSSVTYRVAAINGFGTGPYSVEFAWPVINDVARNYTYIGINGGTSVIATSAGIPILLLPEV